MNSRIEQLQKALWHAQARVAKLEEQIFVVKKMVCAEEITEVSLTEAIDREVRVRSEQVHYDRCRDAFDAGVKAFGERLIALAASHVLTSNRLTLELKKALGEDNTLEGRP